MRTRLILKVVAVCLAITNICHAQNKEKIALLLDRSPAPANAIGYINIPALNELTKVAGFESQASQAMQEVWFIADLDLARFRPKWEAGYAVLKKPIDAEKLAQSLGGYIDVVEGQKVVHSPQQTYFVPGQENPTRLGILRPTNRKLLAGWISPNITIQYSPFLSENANQPESYLSFMMAVDLKDVFSPVPLAARLAGFEALKSHPSESAANTLASIEGFSVIVGRQSLQQCIVKFQFSKPPDSLKLIAADLLAEILEKGGLSAAEVKTWKVTTQDNVLSLQGPLTQSTLSGLLSVFSLQGQAERAAGRPPADAQDKEKQVAYESKNYFDDVTTIIQRTRDHKAKTTGAMASWNDKRARQIDELGTLNVDPAMVAYGRDVAELLRGNALTVRQGSIQAGTVKANQTLDNGYYSDGYGYYYSSNTTSDYQRVTDAATRGEAYSNYRSILSEIDMMTANVRRQMTDKYQIQF